MKCRCVTRILMCCRYGFRNGRRGRTERKRSVSFFSEEVQRIIARQVHNSISVISMLGKAVDCQRDNWCATSHAPHFHQPYSTSHTNQPHPPATFTSHARHWPNVLTSPVATRPRYHHNNSYLIAFHGFRLQHNSAAFVTIW